MRVKNIAPANSYNSLSTLSGLTIEDLFKQTITGYKLFEEIFFVKSSWNDGLFPFLNIIIVSIALLSLLVKAIYKKASWISCLLTLFGIIVFPFFSLLMCILMGRNRVYFTPSYAVFLLYPGAIAVISDGIGLIGQKLPKFKEYAYICVYGIFFLILGHFINYGNGAYAIKQATYDRTISIVTRIMYEMEQTPSYCPGETPVIVLGGLGDSDFYAQEINTIERYRVLAGFGGNTSVSYTQTFESCVKLLGSSIKIASSSEILDEYDNMTAVEQMPCFPYDGYCQMIDGNLVLKLTDSGLD